MEFSKTTEQESKYNDLEHMDVSQIIRLMNAEDRLVPLAIEQAFDQITALTQQVVYKLQNGGRLFYIGAGTSGRLGVVDASECPPTFGVDPNMVIAIIAGGDSAIRNAVEFAEDSLSLGWEDLQSYDINTNDIVIGIAASGTTPYVVTALKACNAENIVTGCITCNKDSPIALTAQFPIEVVVGPEFLTGSSRLKAGTAQKLVLNMISTAAMIQLGKVKGNKMVEMQLSNHKLIERGIQMLIDELNVSYEEAKALLNTYKNVKTATYNYKVHGTR